MHGLDRNGHFGISKYQQTENIVKQFGKTASERVAEALIEDICNGVIRESEPLPSERALCERFSTSRPTIRAAFMSMKANGYLSHETSRRPRACRPSLGSVFAAAGEGLSNLLGNAETSVYLDQVRQFIEVGAVRLAAQEASNLQVVQISAALERCFQSLENDEGFARADVDFHRAIVSVVRNPLILELHDRFVFNIVSKRIDDGNRIELNRLSYEEHRLIYKAISESDPERAMSVMDRHLARSYRANLPEPVRLGGDEEGN